MPGRDIQIGDYVHASKYSDREIGDPWRIGFVAQIITDKFGVRFVIGDAHGVCTDLRAYRHAKRISAEEGLKFLEKARTMCKDLQE